MPRVIFKSLDHFHGRRTVGMAGAKTVLLRAIQSDTSPAGSSVTEFEWFLNFLLTIDKSEYCAIDVAWAKLYHPTVPDPWPAFLVMEEHVKETLRARHLLTATHWSRIGFSYLRVMHILHLEGAVAEANAVSEMLQQHFACVWRRRHPATARYQQDPKLEQLRAQHRNAVNGGRRPQHDTLEPQPNKLPENDAASDDLLDKSRPGIEEPNYDVSSELLELRSRRRR
jgi:hypothetical protein